MNVLRLDTVDSTNAEARRRAEAGERGPLWIVADEQTAGRGRLGRSWISKPGNLYATYVFAPDCAQQALPQLGFAAALAVADTLVALAPRLKWPNDVLVKGAKICGILSEPVLVAPLTVAAGFGINIAHAPEGTPYPVTCWAAHQEPPALVDVQASLAANFETRLGRWRAGFAAVRDDWMEKAVVGAVECDGKRGIVRGIADDGALRFEDGAGKLHKVYSGDVRFLEKLPA